MFECSSWCAQCWIRSHLLGPLSIQLPVMTRAVVPEEQLIVAPTGCVRLKTDDGRKVRVERKHAVTRVASLLSSGCRLGRRKKNA